MGLFQSLGMRHGSDDLCGSKRCEAEGVGGRRVPDHNRPRSTWSGRAPCWPGGSGLGAASGAKRRRQPADGLALAVGRFAEAQIEGL